MALVKCKECGEKVSTKAKACPNCGAKPPKKTSLFTWIVFYSIVAFVGFGIYANITMTPEERTAFEQQRAKEAVEREAQETISAQDTEKSTKGRHVVDDAYALCAALEKTGYVTTCEVQGWGLTVDVRIDTNSTEARKMCSQIVKEMSSYTNNFDGKWVLQIFSPYSGDQPIAKCKL